MVKVRREAERFALRVEDEVTQGNSTDIYARRGKTVKPSGFSSALDTSEGFRRGCPGEQVAQFGPNLGVYQGFRWRARRDSNPQPFDP